MALLAPLGRLLCSRARPASWTLTPLLWPTRCVPRKEWLTRPCSRGRWTLQSTAPCAQMNPDPNQQKTNRVTFKQSTEHVSWRPNLTGEQSVQSGPASSPPDAPWGAQALFLASPPSLGVMPESPEGYTSPVDKGGGFQG